MKKGNLFKTLILFTFAFAFIMLVPAVAKADVYKTDNPSVFVDHNGTAYNVADLPVYYTFDKFFDTNYELHEKLIMPATADYDGAIEVQCGYLSYDGYYDGAKGYIENPGPHYVYTNEYYVFRIPRISTVIFKDNYNWEDLAMALLNQKAAGLSWSTNDIPADYISNDIHIYDSVGTEMTYKLDWSVEWEKKRRQGYGSYAALTGRMDYRILPNVYNGVNIDYISNFPTKLYSDINAYYTVTPPSVSITSITFLGDKLVDVDAYPITKYPEMAEMNTKEVDKRGNAEPFIYTPCAAATVTAEISTDKNFKNVLTFKKDKSCKPYGLSIKLKPNTTYYVRVRNVKGDRSGSYYSEWSKVKKFKLPAKVTKKEIQKIKKQTSISSGYVYFKKNKKMIRYFDSDTYRKDYKKITTFYLYKKLDGYKTYKYKL